MRKLWRPIAAVFLLIGSAPAAEMTLRDISPIDAHAHILFNDPKVKIMLDRLDLHIANITVVDPYERGFGTWEPQRVAALEVMKAAGGRAPWISSFDAADWEDPGFQKRVIGVLDRSFGEGAIGVKIYKTIGMYFKSKSGKYVMPDDPAFSPILDFIASRDKTMYAHIAEPVGAWKPYDPKDPDSGYYQENPGWLMYGHPERPSKETILAARDRMLGRHPNLRIVGCHLGSMEDNVDEVAKRLDQYPNFVVDTAARVTHLALQDREKVRAFLLKYQDRVLYATDAVLIEGDDVDSRLKSWDAELQRDWKFFATSEQVKYMDRSVQGLALPAPVLKKLYHDNAVKWVPGILGKK